MFLTLRSLAHPQRSTALVLALSLIVVGIRSYNDEVLSSSLLLFLGILIIPAALQWPHVPYEVDLEPKALPKGMCQAPEPFIMASDRAHGV